MLIHNAGADSTTRFPVVKVPIQSRSLSSDTDGRYFDRRRER